MACQQFYADRVNADFCHKDNGLREDRASRMAHTDGEEENGQCAQNDQRQGDGCIPAVAGMETGDDAEVHGNAQTVQKQGDPENGFRWKEYRQAEEKDQWENVINKRFKRPQTTAVVARQTAMRMAVSLRIPEST